MAIGPFLLQGENLGSATSDDLMFSSREYIIASITSASDLFALETRSLFSYHWRIETGQGKGTGAVDVCTKALRWRSSFQPCRLIQGHIY